MKHKNYKVERIKVIYKINLYRLNNERDKDRKKKQKDISEEILVFPIAKPY